MEGLLDYCSVRKSDEPLAWLKEYLLEFSWVKP